jgi:hypothetical protein
MNRDEIEARFIDILARGGEPLEVPEIRDAVVADPGLGEGLDELRRFIGRLDEMSWPQLDERKNIRYMTQAFEEGFHQGRTFAAQRAAQKEAKGLGRSWQVAAVAAAAVFVGMVAGAFIGRGMSQNGELDRLRADVQGLQETVAVSLLENQSASQRLRGLQWSQQVRQPGPELITELSQTLRRDDNVNVRLAAADAMGHFAGMPGIRNALYETVLTEPHPLVQVRLIDVMLIVRDPEGSSVLERLLENPALTDVVRIKANAALTEMSDL